jgi:hypothetical protein
VHVSMPDVVSSPGKVMVTAWLYHPFSSAAREGAAPIAGGVLSTLKGFEMLVVPPSLSAEHASVVPTVSVEKVTALQPVVERMIDSGSVTDQFTVTFDVYHPDRPRVPEMIAVMTGGLGSPGTSGRPGARGATSSAPAPIRIRAARARMLGS